MRDPKRIDPILEQLRKLWLKYPDYRFWQVLRILGDTRDNFHDEDDQTLARIKQVLAERG